MQISGNSNTYGASQAQRALSLLLQQKTEGTGQGVPSGGRAEKAGGPPGGRPPGPPPSGASTQFASGTLASLLGVQEQQQAPTAASMATDLIGQADADGDGALSVDEVKTALGADAASDANGLSAAMSKLDTDSDGKLSSDELTAGFEAAKPAHHGGHAHGAGGAPSSDDIAAQLIKDVDSDDDGALSADEISATLGNDSSGLTASITKLDSDGDGKLSAAELSAALDAFKSARQSGQSGSDDGSVSETSATA